MDLKETLRTLFANLRARIGAPALSTFGDKLRAFGKAEGQRPQTKLPSALRLTIHERSPPVAQLHRTARL
jgi:hypothetical protein